MRKVLLNRLFIILTVSLLASCAKDLGNYSYHDVNKITFRNIDTLKGYQVLFGDMLSIDPTLDMTIPPAAGVSYEWSLRLNGNGGNIPPKDSVISVEKALNVKIELKPGTYSLQYRVMDKSTGIRFQARATLTVSTAVYEGYLVLNEVNGQSRMDMLSYKALNSSFTQYTDVLKLMNSTLDMRGAPYQVLCMTYNQANIDPENYGIFVLNASGTNRINQETFAYIPSYSIRYLILGDVPANFAPQRLTGEMSGSAPYYGMYDNGNMYTYSTNAGRAFKYSPVNVYATGGTPFRVAPWIVTNGSAAVMFNMDKRTFVTAATYSSVAVADVPESFKYPVGYDLVFMDKDYNNKVFAILKDPATSKYYLHRFTIGQARVEDVQEIQGTDIANATNFTLSPTLGYLFYSAGGKLYEYDPGIRQSILMADKGTSQISYLSFQRFYNRLSNSNLNYRNWANLLTVASYDPAGTMGSNGTLELDSIPPVNGQIIKKSSWSGFGKVVSVAYRER
jgi:hypothetical protein